MDVLVMGNYLLHKEEQPPYPIDKGHIEHYDPNELLDPAEDPGLEPLRRLFWERFLPVSNRYLNGDGRRVEESGGNVPGKWYNCDTQSAAGLFEIPVALDENNSDPSARAAAIVEYWQPDAPRKGLEPLISRLLEIGKELSAESEEELVEEVSEFVYVMY
jgi:hypothetical protein